jgi:hypothetical protein
MPSENAKAVAEEVLATLGKGGKVSVSAIARRKGYSRSVAKNPKQITTTKSFQDVIRPVVDRLIEERDRAIALLADRAPAANYRDLNDAIDKLTKNIQLLSGGATENIAAKVVYLPERKEHDRMDPDTSPEARA